jgi:serine/threonine-protein phosphatase 5
VPLSTLVSATRRPSVKENVILSPDGFKRYFITHGGLFSKDGVTLDEIRKIKRIGRQPGTEGLMCTFLVHLCDIVQFDSLGFTGEVRTFNPSLLEVEC